MIPIEFLSSQIEENLHPMTTIFISQRGRWFVQQTGICRRNFGTKFYKSQDFKNLDFPLIIMRFVQSYSRSSGVYIYFL